MTNYVFLVLNGVGISDKSGTIQIHLPQKIDVNYLFDKSESTFSGQIRSERLRLRVRHFKIGQKVKVYDWFTGSYSRPFRVEDIFKTPDISYLVRPSAFHRWLGDGKLKIYHNITSSREAPAYTSLIWSLFRQAMSTDSWIVGYSQTQADTHFRSPLAMDFWLGDLIQAGLVSRISQVLVVEDALVYLMMHAINNGPGMITPVFKF